MISAKCVVLITKESDTCILCSRTKECRKNAAGEETM